MNLTPITEIANGSKVLLRMDLDLPIENGTVVDISRLEKSLPTIRELLAKKCKVLIIGHRGRPKGVDKDL